MWKFPREYFQASLSDERELFINRLNWTDKENFLVDTNKGPGQEFVINSEKNPKVINWAVDLIKNYG